MYQFQRISFSFEEFYTIVHLDNTKGADKGNLCHQILHIILLNSDGLMSIESLFTL